jgi:hypothetical protein
MDRIEHRFSRQYLRETVVVNQHHHPTALAREGRSGTHPAPCPTPETITNVLILTWSSLKPSFPLRDLSLSQPPTRSGLIVKRGIRLVLSKKSVGRYATVGCTAFVAVPNRMSFKTWWWGGTGRYRPCASKPGLPPNPPSQLYRTENTESVPPPLDPHLEPNRPRGPT